MQPSRRTVDFSFWLSNIGVILGIAMLVTSADGTIGMGTITPIAVASIASLVYMVAIGMYVQKFNRTGIIWSGIVFLLGPLGIWGTYIALFVIGDKLQVAER